MKKVTQPHQHYRPYPRVDLPDREWPNKSITHAPVWCSVDLRDGNQALSIPMNVEEKIRMFELLVAIGFREIEVGFPSASEIEYQFVRRLIEENRIPPGVTIQVLTQSREHLIRRTFEAVRGADKAIIHLYNSTSKAQRDVVFRKNKDEIKAIAVEGTKLIRSLKEQDGGRGIRLEYSPESFPGTELDYALDVCNAVIEAWGASPKEKVIINLPTTVEMSTPNVFADRIEWFGRNVRRREAVIISVHTHNDRGTGVASAELAVMAGAERVEGALFGNGERSGNMDIVTMALNLFTQGVDPQLDFSDIDKVAEVYKECTRMDIHPRHPYAGELVYTAFSGSHQDAINKGMKARDVQGGEVWDVPYLPINPEHVGRTYEAIIRINSQSGKGGVAYVMEKDWGFRIPKEMQPEFARAVQERAERDGELSPAQIKQCFDEEYLPEQGGLQLTSCSIQSADEHGRETAVSVTVRDKEGERKVCAKGNGPVDAFVRGVREQFGYRFDLTHYSEHALSQGANAEAVAYIGIKTEDGQTVFGVGVDENISVASIRAVLSAVNRFPEVSGTNE